MRNQEKKLRGQKECIGFYAKGFQQCGVKVKLNNHAMVEFKPVHIYKGNSNSESKIL